MEGLGTEAVVWGFNTFFGVLLAIVGFFVKQLVSDQRLRGDQIAELAQRIVVLEERERGLSHQIEELKGVIDSLAGDVRFVREKIVMLTNTRPGNHSER